MTNLTDILPQEGIAALANQLGISSDEAQRGAQSLLPSILAGLHRQAAPADAVQPGGLLQQIEALGGPHLAQNVVGPQPTDVGKGNQLLGTIFGSKDVSRQVAGEASQHSGLDASLLKRMLPILTMLIAGHLAKHAGGQQGGLGGVLSSVIGGLNGGKAAGGGLGGLLSSALGGAL